MEQFWNNIFSREAVKTLTISSASRDAETWRSPHNMPMQAQGYSSNAFATRRYKELDGQHYALAALVPGRVWCRKMGGPRSRSGRHGKSRLF